MAQKPQSYRNLWGLTVLCLLIERPMHPYEMQRVIRQRKKSDFLDLKRGSLYHAIKRLQDAGLIIPVETVRDGKRPERTVYRITNAGVCEVRSWLRELLAIPIPEATQFYAAISFVGHLTPGEVTAQLTLRGARLEAELKGLDAAIEGLQPQLGRVVLLEAEYTRDTKRAELAWVRSLIADIDGGRLTWDPASLASGELQPVEGELGADTARPNAEPQK
jgi:DNA-binding PadR family transcriptional regulator